MTTKPVDLDHAPRQLAEEKLRLLETAPLNNLSGTDLSQLIHELRLHQTELEMQNEELRRARHEQEIAKRSNFDLYYLAPVGYLILNEKGVICKANLSAATMLGMDPNELLEKPISSLIVPADQDMYSLGYEKLLAGKKPVASELRFLTKDGTQLWVHLSVNVVQDHSTDIEQNPELATRFLVTFNEITEQKLSEEALRKSQYFHAETEKIGKVGGWEFHTDTREQTWTEEVYRIHEVDLDFKPTVINGVSFYTPASRPIIERLVQRAIEHGEPFDVELEIITAKGNHRNVHAIGKSEPDRQKIVGFFQDITERKQAEKFREMTHEILQILNESGALHDLILRVLTILKARTGFDAVGIRLQEGEDFPYFVQHGFSIDFLLTENTLIERNADGGVCRDNNGHVSLECTCGLVLSGKSDPTNPLFTPGGSIWTNDSFLLLDIPPGEDPRYHPRNQCIHEGYASVALVPIRNMNRIIGLVQFNDRRKGCFTINIVELLEGVASHIGETMVRKWAEDELRRKDAEIEQFIYNVAHDLRSPLVTVKAFTGYLKKDMAAGNQEQVTQDIQFINNAADKMELMLNELLEMARIGRVETPLVMVSLSEIVANTLDTLAGAIKERNVEILLPDMDLTMFGDRLRLCQIWQNLVENAIKYSRSNCIPRIELGIQQIRGETVFFVKDNGIGIDPRHRRKIFEIFEKMDPNSQGVGLGLSMVQRIVEKYGGRIWVESEGIGMGSCFYFNLPSVVVKSDPD